MESVRRLHFARVAGMLLLLAMAGLSYALGEIRFVLQPGDGPYLELSEKKHSVHGGIEDAFLSPHHMRLTLNARGAEALGAGDVHVTLATPGEQRRLERALGRVLRGVPFTSDRSLTGLAAAPE